VGCSSSQAEEALVGEAATQGKEALEQQEKAQQAPPRVEGLRRGLPARAG